MIRNLFPRIGLLVFFIHISIPCALSQSDTAVKPVPENARQQLVRANALVEQEKFADAVSMLRKAIAIAPNFLQAHARYVYVKAYLIGEIERVRSEYETSMAKDPGNAIYPAALGLALFTEPQQQRRQWFEQVIRLTPDSAWGHYAKAQLLKGKAPEPALTELEKAIEMDPTFREAFEDAIFIQERQLNKIGEALVTAEKFAGSPEFRPLASSDVWRLRLKADPTAESAAKLRQELSQIKGSSNSVAMLAAVRTAYSDLLNDKPAAATVEVRIKRIDPSWYPERGVVRSIMELTESGPRRTAFGGHQLNISSKLREMSLEVDPEKQTEALAQLLRFGPTKPLQRAIYARLFALARKAASPAAIAYGERLVALDTNDPRSLAMLAVLMADQKQNLKQALHYALRSEVLTAEFQPKTNIPDVKGDSFFEEYYSEQKQLERYRVRRADALGAHGWVLFQSENYAEAETKLRAALEFERSEKTLSHLSEILTRLKRLDEAAQFANEARNAYAASTRRQFKNIPAKDFELSTIDGRKIRLSDLKGKIVMVNFWATWCKPCAKEMPVFVKAYEKYKDRGFEILAVTIDDKADLAKVVLFATTQKVNFPILYDDGTAKLYNVTVYPSTFFIGRQGNIRHQNSGFSVENGWRDLQVIIEELMKDT